MLNSNEKKKLRKRKDLKAKTRANLDYRVAQKIKKRLNELDDINVALCSIPPKNARRALDDKMVASMFQLTENILGFLGYSPIIEDSMSGRSIIRCEKIMSTGPKSEEMRVIREAPTAEDEARQLLLKDHIEKLQSFANPKFQTQPGFINRPALFDGRELYKKWRPEHEEAGLDY